MSRPRRPADPAKVAARFWAKVDRSAGPDACWLWTGSISPLGYGRFSDGEHKVKNASRVAYELTHGALADPRLFVCHGCDRPPCCNPAHLFLGTPRDNMRDAMRKGRLQPARARRRGQDLAAALFAWRIREDLTCAEAADVIGASHHVYARWEAGSAAPRWPQHVHALLERGIDPRLFPHLREALDLLGVA